MSHSFVGSMCVLEVRMKTAFRVRCDAAAYGVSARPGVLELADLSATAGQRGALLQSPAEHIDAHDSARLSRT